MIIILLLYCVGIPLTAIFLSAPDDKGQIDRNEAIEHRSQWMERVGIAMAGAAMVCYALIVKFDQSPWVIGPVVLAAWPLFSLPFRVSLNLRRKRDWRYVAPWSATYDRVWYAIATVYWMSQDSLEMDRDWYIKGDFRSVTGDVHRAGFIASLFELILFAFCCWWMAQIVNP